MKKVMLVLVLAAVFFLGAKSSGILEKKLSPGCRIEYRLSSDGKKVSAIKIVNGDSRIQVSYSEDYSCFSIENNDSISCRINASSEQIEAYSIRDEKAAFECTGNVYEKGNGSFKIQTPCFEDVTNAFVSSDEAGRVEKQIVLEGKESYLFHIGKDGKYDVEYKADLYGKNAE